MRNAKDDLITCEESESANELSRIALYWIQVAEAYRELSEAQAVTPIDLRIIGHPFGAPNKRTMEAKAKVKELEAKG